MCRATPPSLTKYDGIKSEPTSQATSFKISTRNGDLIFPSPPPLARSRASSTAAQTKSSTRASLASLFGGSSKPAPVVPAEEIKVDVPEDKDGPGLPITAWVIDRPLRRVDVAKAITQCTESRIHASLEGTGVPPSIVEKVVAFILQFQQRFAIPTTADARPSPFKKATKVAPAVPDLSDPETSSSVLQSFFASTHSDLEAFFIQRKHIASPNSLQSRLKRVSSSTNTVTVAAVRDSETETTDVVTSETELVMADVELEKIEAIVCSELFDL